MAECAIGCQLQGSHRLKGDNMRLLTEAAQGVDPA
jgi:hypothetical protein